jgi:putative DNA primase/helicase
MNPTDCRLLLLKTGFDPTPCNGKAPVLKDWASRDKTNPAEIGLWSSPAGFPDAQNTGLRTKFMPAIDIDITDAEVAEAVEELAREIFEEHGATPCRIGQAPKRALLLRTDEPFKKLVRSFFPKNGNFDPAKPPKIEILCEGQQLIAFGIHPDTHSPYNWPCGAPGEIKREDLPYVREADMVAFLDAVEKRLEEEFGWKVEAKRPNRGNGGTGGNGSEDWGWLYANIIAGRDLHDSILALAGKMLAVKMDGGAIVNAIWGVMEASTAPHDKRWQERYDAIPRTVAYVQKQEAAKARAAASEVPPAGDKTYTHLWRSQDHDFPCTPTGVEWRDADGRIYAEVSTPDETSTVPKDELVRAQGGNGTAEGEDDEPPPPADTAEIRDDTPPPPGNVTDIRPKLKRKGAREAAAAHRQPQPGAHKPLIPLRPGHLPETLDAAAGALLAASFPVLALDTVLVCPLRKKRSASDGREVETTRFIPIAPAQMQRWLAEAADFTKFDKRSNRYVPCDPPLALAVALLNTPASWSFPSVIGLSSCPVMRADGTICAANGYDPATQLYLALDPGFAMPDIPEHPTREQAKAALDLLLGLLDEFRFEGNTDRAVALAWLMVPALRPAMRVVPMILFRANVSGSGKSYLVDLGAAVASGQEAAAVVGAGPDNEETEKRLSSLLLEGATHIAVDNVDFDIPGTSIWCHISERPRLRVRILGMSKTPHIDNAAYITVTGNNIQPKDDLIRRVLTCTMNVAVEQPERRKFEKNPVRMVLADRGRYLGAIFTIAKHYRAAGSPDLGDDMWESYAEFVQLVRNPLRHLDANLDPVRSVDTARAEDPTVVAIKELFGHWGKLLKVDEPAGAYEVYEKATERDSQTETLRHPEFQDLLQRVCAGRYGKISSKSIGSWLKRIKGRVIGGRRLVAIVDPNLYHGARYKLEDAPPR